MAQTFSSKLGGVPLMSDQLASAVLRLQQMQDDGGEGQKSFDQGLQRTENANKAMDNNAAREDELVARKNKAKYEGSDYADKLKDFQANNPTYGQLFSMQKSAAPAFNANKAVNSPLPGTYINTSPGAGVLGAKSSILAGIGGL